MGISSIGGGMSTYGSKGMGGLMSGLDVDELVKGMTMGTSNKIAKLMQNKQTNLWKTDAYRSISSPLIDFANKYINTTSDTNLSGSTLFSKSSITASGFNSKYLSVTGRSNSSDSLNILEVKKLAEDAARSLSGGASGAIISGDIDFNAEVPVNNLKGQTLSVKYGDKNYNITLKDKVVTDTSTTPPTTEALSYETWDDTVASLNKLIEFDPTLRDLKDNVSFEKSGDNFVIKNDGDKDLDVLSGTGDTLKMLGIDNTFKVAAGATGTATEELGMTGLEALAGKSMSFTYNGVTKSITLGEEADINTVDKLAADIQTKISKAFGNNRIKVEADGSKLKLTTTLPNGNADTSSVLKLGSAGIALLGDTGVLKMQAGTSNRVNLNATVEKSGLKGMGNMQTVTLQETYTDTDGTEKVRDYEGYSLKINGTQIDFKATDSVGAIMSKINNSKSGVNITYNEVADTFNIKATESGTGGQTVIEDIGGNLAEKLFNNNTPNDVYTNSTEKNGQDAEIVVDFDGIGQGADPVTITRGSNNFNLDGLNVTINQVFDSYKKDSNGNYLDDTGAVTTDPAKYAIDGDKLVRFTAKVDDDKVVDAIKKMAEDYNKMVDLISTSAGQKHEKKYPPLTAEQRKEMSEDEIKTWEEKAKEGLLFNDPTLNSLANDLRFIFSSYTDEGLKGIGISNTGTGMESYKNNGKISIDETALRKALAERPDDVTKLFTAPMAKKTVNGEEVADTSTGGVMTRMKDVIDKYAKTTGAEKGILINKAGHPSSPVSMIDNLLLKANEEIDKSITRFQAVLESEQARHYKKFTQLEQLVAQMNSQSSALSEFTGG